MHAEIPALAVPTTERSSLPATPFLTHVVGEMRRPDSTASIQLAEGGSRPATEAQVQEAAHELAASLADRITANTNRGQHVDQAQNAINGNYLTAMRKFLTTNLAGLPEHRVNEIINVVTNDLAVSYQQINNIKETVQPVIESATAAAVDGSRRDNRNITAAELTDAVTKRVHDNTIFLFKNNAANSRVKLLELLKSWLEASPRSYSVEKVAGERLSLTDSFTKAQQGLDELAKEYEKALDGTKEDTRESINLAIIDRLADSMPMPFYIAPDRPLIADVPALAAADAPPADDRAKKALKIALDSATNRAALESFATSGTTVSLPLTISLPLGLVTAAASNWQKGLAAGTVCGVIQLAQPLIRDALIGRAELRRHLTGVDRNNELRRLSSVYNQARVALADRYGPDWLNDFEKWTLRPHALSLNNAITIANTVRGELNHHLLLTEEYTQAKSIKDSPASHSIADLNEADRTIMRYKNEHKAIKKELAKNVFQYGEQDHVGIRCLSHMRDKALSDDAKKLNEHMRANLRFNDEFDIIEETESWIRNRFKNTSEQFVFPVQRLEESNAVATPRPTLRTRRGYEYIPDEPMGSSLSAV